MGLNHFAPIQRTVAGSTPEMAMQRIKVSLVAIFFVLN